MNRTTPPRPVDIAALFPELARLARTTTRLHPRPGSPTWHDSSIGGPLLWPADEPWPTCAGEHHFPDPPRALADVRSRREILTAAWRRNRPGTDLLTPREKALLEQGDAGHPPGREPNAMLPVAQLYARDIPALRRPEGTDLLQVLWCPLTHSDGLPAVHLVWRAVADVEGVTTDPPVPADVDHYGSYVPEPCLVHPEAVTEYPAPHELDEDLARRVHAWNDRDHPAAPQGGPNAGRRDVDYQFDLSVAPGWKVGGWGPWSFSDAWPMVCEACAAPMDPLLTVASDEWDGGNRSWIPAEDRDRPADAPSYRAASQPTMVSIGRGDHMQIYICSASFDHPIHQNMQ
ncbi:hypothetical protein [Embleya hyalina]|nr:hypothetical protein [Embleya hyalina]